MTDANPHQPIRRGSRNGPASPVGRSGRSAISSESTRRQTVRSLSIHQVRNLVVAHICVVAAFVGTLV